jgi:uncharacterized protein YciI
VTYIDVLSERVTCIEGTSMKYAAVIEYSQDKAKVEAARPAHRAYLTSLVEKGQLFASGPFEDAPGALIIYEADSPEGVESLMKADPFHAAGVFTRWTVRPWKMVFFNSRLAPQS